MKINDLNVIACCMWVCCRSDSVMFIILMICGKNPLHFLSMFAWQRHHVCVLCFLVETSHHTPVWRCIIKTQHMFSTATPGLPAQRGGWVSKQPLSTSILHVSLCPVVLIEDYSVPLVSSHPISTSVSSSYSSSCTHTYCSHINTWINNHVHTEQLSDASCFVWTHSQYVLAMNSTSPWHMTFFWFSFEQHEPSFCCIYNSIWYIVC